MLDEIHGLIKKDVFGVKLRHELPDGPKSKADGTIRYKARYVIGGHRDSLKHYLVHSAQSLQPTCARLLLMLAALFVYEVCPSDVKLAYVQSTEPLSKRIFI